jgi:hypothetical protein
MEAEPVLAVLPFGTSDAIGTVGTPAIGGYGEENEGEGDQEEDNHVFFLSSWPDQE